MATLAADSNIRE